MKKNKCDKGFVISAILISTMILAISVLSLYFLPEKIAIHLNLNGEADKYSNQYLFVLTGVALYILPMIMLLIFSKIKENDLSRLIGIIGAFVMSVAFFGVALSLVIITAKTSGTLQLNYESFISFFATLIGCIMFILSHFLILFSRNQIFGIRTKKSLSSEENWRKINKISSLIFYIAGLIIMIVTILLKDMYSLIPLVSVVLFCGIFIYFVNKKTGEKNYEQRK